MRAKILSFNDDAGFIASPSISNGRLAMMLLIGTETILFSSFIGAYLVLRMGAAMWPPAGTPALTIGLSAFNSALLVFSSWMALGFGERSGVRPLAVFGMGSLFLALQGVEFHRLYARGLTLQTGTYGALFYSLIGCHGLHVIGGLIILAIAYFKRGEWLDHAGLYWHFVTGVWLVLFTILYIL